MVRLLAFAALIAGVGWWTTETGQAWSRPGTSPADLQAALSVCRAETTSGLQGLVPHEVVSLDRCMTQRGWVRGTSPDTQVAALH
jgi:hypothetical protein